MSGLGGSGGGSGGGGGGEATGSAKLCLGLGVTLRLPVDASPPAPDTPPRLLRLRVFFLVYEDNRTPFLESIFFLLHFSRALTGMFVGSKLNVESSLWSVRSFLLSWNNKYLKTDDDRKKLGDSMSRVKLHYSSLTNYRFVVWWQHSWEELLEVCQW